MQAVKEQNWGQDCQETGTEAGTFWLMIRKMFCSLGQDSHRTMMSDYENEFGF